MHRWDVSTWHSSPRFRSQAKVNMKIKCKLQKHNFKFLLSLGFKSGEVRGKQIIRPDVQIQTIEAFCSALRVVLFTISRNVLSKYVNSCLAGKKNVAPQNQTKI